MSLNIYGTAPTPQPLGKKLLQSLKQKIPFKSFFGKEKLIPLSQALLPNERPVIHVATVSGSLHHRKMPEQSMLHVTKVTLELRFLRDIVARKVRKAPCHVTYCRMWFSFQPSTSRCHAPAWPSRNPESSRGRAS